MTCVTGRLHRALGSRDLDTLFGEAPTTTVPWPSASRNKYRATIDHGVFWRAFADPDRSRLAEVDPCALFANQPAITRAGVAYYLHDPAYHRTGTTYADMDKPINRLVLIYRRDDGQNIIVTGHHRSAAALLAGRPVLALPIDGPWGPPR